MLVPSTRLIVIAAVVFIPAAIVPLIDPALLPVAITLALVVPVAAAVDASLAYRSLDGIGAELPDTVRLTKDRLGEIGVVISRAGKGPSRLRVALDEPEGFQPIQHSLVMEMAADVERVQLVWPCKPSKRGLYELENVYVETSSLLGLWSVRRTLPAQSQLRVYPNLSTERRHAAALFLNRGRFGAHAHRQVGKGREFEKLREYVPGDSYEDIHWKATARRHIPIAKQFQIERTQEVYVVIDASRLSAREMPEGAEWRAAGENRSITNQLERFIASALILGVAAERQGDLFGLLSFSDRVENFVRAKGGKAHFAACREAIYALEARRVNPDFGEVAAFIRGRLRKRALLIVLTNLDDPILAESFVESMSLVSRHHLILVNMLQPVGVEPLFSPGRVEHTDDLYDRLAGHIQWRALTELKSVLQRRNVTMSLLDHSTMTSQLVSQYMSVKQRQVL